MADGAEGGRAKRLAREESGPDPPRASAHRSDAAACRAGRLAFRATRAAPGRPASGAAVDRGHRPDRGRAGRALSKNHAHRTPRGSEPAAFRSRERCLWKRRPCFGRAIFNAQALGFQQQAAEAQAKQVLAQYEQTVLVAFREVEDALVAVRTAREQTEAQEAQVGSLRSALHLAEIRYKGGLSNYLDVLTAKRNLFDVELSLTATRRLRLVSIIQLYKALGGGWSPSDAVQRSGDPGLIAAPAGSRFLSSRSIE